MVFLNCLHLELILFLLYVILLIPFISCNYDVSIGLEHSISHYGPMGASIQGPTVMRHEIVVVPEHSKQLQVLTFTSFLITREWCCVLSSIPSRDQVSDQVVYLGVRPENSNQLKFLTFAPNHDHPCPVPFPVSVHLSP